MVEQLTEKLIQALRLLTAPGTVVAALVVCVVMVLASPVILVTYVLWDFGDSTDEVVVQREQTSPTGDFVARYFTISGGGAAGYVSQRVNVQLAKSVFDQSSGIILELSHSEIASLEWKSNNVLVVRLSKKGTIYSRKERPDNEIPVQVEFEEY